MAGDTTEGKQFSGWAAISLFLTSLSVLFMAIGFAQSEKALGVCVIASLAACTGVLVPRVARLLDFGLRPGLAVFAVVAILVLGTVQLPFVTGIVTGIVGLRQVHNAKGQLRGRRAALVAVLGSVMSGLAVLAYLIFWYHHPGAAKAQCLGNVRDITQALDMYASDNGGGYPEAARWESSIVPYLTGSTPLSCPAATATGHSYAYNAAMSAVNREEVLNLDELVMVFESDASRDAGGPELLPTRPRHNGGDVYGFADGSVQWRPRNRAKGLQWEPVLTQPAEGGNQKKPEPDGERQE